LDNIKIIKTGINVSKIVRQLEMYPEDWGMQKRVDGAQSMLDRGFPEIEAGVLQLVVGGIELKDNMLETQKFAYQQRHAEDTQKLLIF
jgi:hypothetical protein